MKIKIFLIVALILNLAFGQIIYNNTGHVPTQNQVEWHKAGLLSGWPKEAHFQINVTNYSGYDNSELSSAIIEARDYTSKGAIVIIHFSEGSAYTFNETIELTPADSNLIFQGSSNVELNFSNLSKNSPCFLINGEPVGSTYDLSDDWDMNSNDISGNLSSFSDGDWVHVYESQFPDFEDNETHNWVGQITSIDNNLGSDATLRHKASRDYSDSNQLKIRKINPVRNIGFEDFNLTGRGGDESDDGYDGSNFIFDYAVNCWVKGVYMSYAKRHHVHIKYSSNLYISGCYFNDAACHDVNSYGYGTLLTCSSNYCLIENNIYKRLRHSISTVGGANANVFTYNYSREQYATIYGVPYKDSDICLHGNYPYSNLFENNYVTYIEVDNEHDINGPYNLFLRNRCYNDAIDQWGYGTEAGEIKAGIKVKNGENTSVFGCEVSEIEGTNGGLYYPSSLSGIIDVYGFENESCYVCYTHYYYWYNNQNLAGTILKDISYYYSSEPDFVSNSGLSFPSLGPKYLSTDNISHSIPARKRYLNSSTKTYCVQTPIAEIGSTINSYRAILGNMDIDHDVTISSSGELEILSGSSINFAYQKKLLVEGKITAIGSSTRPIQFSTSDSYNRNWYGIKMEDAGSNSSFNYCEIEYANNGIWLVNSSPLVQNSYIHNNSNGIYMVSTSSPVLKNNTISNNGLYGIYCQNNCEPEFGEYGTYNSTYGYNRIHDNSYGVVAEWNSTVIAGIFYEDVVPNCRYNSIFDNSTYDAWASDSDIIANWAYWGDTNYPPLSSQFYTSNGGTIERTVPLQNDPGGGSSLAKSTITDKENKFDPNNIDKNDPAQLYELAKYQRFIVDVDEALLTLKDLVNRFPESKYAEKSLVQIFHISEKHKIKGLTSYFASQKVKKYPTEFQNTFENLQILKSVRDKEYNNAEKLCLDKLGRNLDTENEVFTLYQLVSLNHTKFDNKSQASNYLEIMKTKYPNNPNTLSARSLIGEEVDWQQTQSLQKVVSEYQNENYVTKFHLAPPYPNPFNPSTTISFTLEKQSKIDIRIYNIQGKEVWNWGNNLEYGSGYHNITWNAKDDTGNELSTGVYFVKLIAGNKVATQKVIFMK